MSTRVSEAILAAVAASDHGRMLRLLIQNLPRFGSDSSLRWWTARAHASSGDDTTAKELYWRAFAHAIAVGRALEAVASLRELERLEADTEHGWDQLFGELAARGFARPGPTSSVAESQPDLDATRPDLPEAALLGVAAELARQSTPAEAGGARFRTVPWLSDLPEEVVRWLLLRLDLQLLAADEPLAVWTARLPAFTLGGAFDTRGGRMAPPAGAMLWSTEDDGLSADGPALLLLVRPSEVHPVQQHPAIVNALQNLRRRRDALRALTLAPWWSSVQEAHQPAWLQAMAINRIREGQSVHELVEADAALFSTEACLYLQEGDDNRTPLDAGQLVVPSRVRPAAVIARSEADIVWFSGAAVERLQRLDPAVFESEQRRLAADRGTVQTANSSMIELLDEDLETGPSDAALSSPAAENAVPDRSEELDMVAASGQRQIGEDDTSSTPQPSADDDQDAATAADEPATDVADP